MKRGYRSAMLVWIALMVLLALTCGSAFIAMGAWNTVANFAVAALKALLVAAFFMHLLAGRPVYRIVVLGALFALSLLLGLSSTDYSTRQIHPAPWQVPHGAIQSGHGLVCRMTIYAAGGEPTRTYDVQLGTTS